MKTKKNVSMMCVTLFTICIILGTTIVNNGLISIDLNRVTQITEKKSCQQKVADIIFSDGEDDRSLLQVLLMDSGFYTASGIVPKSKYFYTPNLPLYKYPDVYLSQYEDINKKLNNYVISSFEAQYDKNLDQEKINYQNHWNKISSAIAQNYELISVVDGTYLQDGTKFYLYKRIP